MAKRYKFLGSLVVTDIDNYFDKGPIEIKEPSQFTRNWFKDGYPTQHVQDKLGKNHAWDVIASQFDDDGKGISFKVMVNAHTSAIHHLDYADICESMGWKSYKFSDDKMLIIPEFKQCK